MSDRAEFSVYQFFPDDSSECLCRFVTAKEAVDAAMTYTHNVAARVGITRRVIITDGLDFTVFEWIHGCGITFPPHFPLDMSGDAA